MRIDIEEIQLLKKRLREFNRLSIYDMEFYENGEKLDISKQILKEWEFVDLNNSDFIDSEFWKARMEDSCGHCDK